MSKWTDFRDDTKNLMKDHPKKVGAIIIVSVILARLVPWVWGLIF